MTGALLTVPEAAEHLGRSTAFVRGLIADGVVSAERHRGRWYITRAALEAWLKPPQAAPAPVQFARRVEVRRRG